MILPALSQASGAYAKAQYHYQMHCQGCHTPGGVGGNGVPRLRGVVGHFLKSPEGRAYLLRVPGTAHSALDDQALSAVMNWTLARFGGDSLPADWQAYSASEVAAYRKNPLAEILAYRAAVLHEIMHAEPAR